jgi:two-component system, LuxR family, sensor kinase FixL
VLGDQVMIQQVLVNLARNAIEAMRGEAGERRLSLKARAGAKEVEIRVEDTGPGVEAQAAARMFQPFYSTKDGGMGVGLGVCRSIVELHGGRLWHSPAKAGGSVFHLALPRAAA